LQQKNIQLDNTSRILRLIDMAGRLAGKPACRAASGGAEIVVGQNTVTSRLSAAA
jgi:hypothetical protein